MKLNVFEGARRIGLAFGGIWVIGCLAYAVFATPYASVTYALEWPGEAATKVESCAKEDATESAAVKTSKGDSVGVMLCLTAHKATDGRLLVPFSVRYSESNSPPTATLKEVEGNPFAGDKNSIVWDRGTTAGRDLSAELFGGWPSKTAPVPAPKAPLRTADKSSEARPWDKDIIVTPEYIMNERYSSEVIKYGREVAAHFSLSPDGMKDAEQAVWDARIKQWKDALQFAFGGVAFLWAAVTGIGWIVRGFMGIPRGKDTRPAG